MSQGAVMAMIRTDAFRSVAGFAAMLAAAPACVAVTCVHGCVGMAERRGDRNSVGMEMVETSADRFMMGSDDGFWTHRPAHMVRPRARESPTGCALRRMPLGPPIASGPRHVIGSSRVVPRLVRGVWPRGADRSGRPHSPMASPIGPATASAKVTGAARPAHICGFRRDAH